MLCLSEERRINIHLYSSVSIRGGLIISLYLSVYPEILTGENHPCSNVSTQFLKGILMTYSSILKMGGLHLKTLSPRGVESHSPPGQHNP